jgi:hypothetical protein
VVPARSSVVPYSPRILPRLVTSPRDPPRVWHGGGGGRRWRSTVCFSGWPVWEVTVDDVQRTTEEATCSERRRGRRGA